ncbi:MAG: hypothetical protein ABID54_14940 [Pseudomonadota bacterium]
MPYDITKVGKGKFKVTSPHGTKAKSTSLANAKKQTRLLQAIEHNPNFKPRKEKK